MLIHVGTKSQLKESERKEPLSMAALNTEIELGLDNFPALISPTSKQNETLNHNPKKYDRETMAKIVQSMSGYACPLLSMDTAVLRDKPLRASQLLEPYPV